MKLTLKSKFVLGCITLSVLVLILGAISVWNLMSFYRAGRVAAAEYDAMDHARAVVVQVGWLRDSLRGADARSYNDIQYFAPLEREVAEINRQTLVAAEIDDGDAHAEGELAAAVSDHLAAAMSAVGSGDEPSVKRTAVAANELDQAYKSLQAIAKLLPDTARRHVAVATERARGRITWMCIWLLIVLAISAAIHVKQFRMLVRPLVWLRTEMKRSAASDFKDEIRPRGDQEFRDVAGFFNGLARDLAELYWSLEKKVVARSRELVRSERLASVGFLAAGVAHEINNPLSVISGYAELAAKSLRAVLLGDGNAHTSGAAAEAEAQALTSALDAQGIIRDEAFRCKEITSRLLSLARGSHDGRESMYLDDVARQVTVLTRGLKNYSDRRVVLDFKQTEPLEVFANMTEMKQVLLNLTVNALEAVPPDRGEVRIGGRRSGEWIELSVEDNGKGMSPETLEHVFEPFFTAKRGAGEPGTGLGLSITHAIIESHGGGISAESRGPGRGSRFTVRLPARHNGAAMVAGT